jgi:NADPH:quinone reductase-like Zn-dependent oxidoreductase
VRDHGRVKAGGKVLIVGASGGVGSFAVQIAKAFGAEVTGVCSTAKVDMVGLMVLRELIESGKIEPVIDRTYPLGDVATAIRHLVEGHPRGKIVIAVQDPGRG